MTHPMTRVAYWHRRAPSAPPQRDPVHQRMPVRPSPLRASWQQSKPHKLYILLIDSQISILPDAWIYRDAAAAQRHQAQVSGSRIIERDLS